MSLSRNQYIFGGIIGVLIILGLLLMAVWKIPHVHYRNYRQRFTEEYIQTLEPEKRIQLEKNAADIENSNRATVAQIIVTFAQIIGGVALLVGLYFTYQNVKAAQDNVRI